jgi:ABC-type spermidine/putrescine transport systems, ATPase components
MEILTLKNISFSYKDKVIFDNYNFVMNKEEIIAMIGPSGCGKSTLLKIINGLETDYSGDVLLDGVNVNNIPVNKRDIVLMFQDNLLFPHMTIFENIEFSLKMEKYPKHEIKKMVEEVAKDIHLQDKLNKYPKELSGGQQRRVALARAVISKPKLLLLDEPFTGLDKEIKLEIMNLVKIIREKYNTSIIFVTHDLSEAEYLKAKYIEFKKEESL